MKWLADLFTQPGFIQAVCLISIISAAGIALGRIKVKGVSLGVTFVFFIGIVMGEIYDRLGIGVNADMMNVIQNFGLIIFVYMLGVQVGPGFVGSFKKGGIKLNLLGLMVIALTTVTAVIIYAVLPVSFTDSMGLLCGAATNTPMLGAAQQALLDAHPSFTAKAASMASACAVGYPFGVFGVLCCLIAMRIIFRKRYSTQVREPLPDTYVAEFHISNPAIFDKTIGKLPTYTDKSIIISRLWRDGKVEIPSSATVLRKDDHILAVLNRADVESFNILFGEKEDTDWNRPDIDWDNIDGSDLVSKHIVVTKPALNGVKIGSLHLRHSFDINITRVNRAGVQLIANPGLRLQLGDRLTVVGSETAIAKVGEILGNEEKTLKNPNLIAIFIGLVLGVLLGMMPLRFAGMSTPVKLGVAGGPIVVGILMGAFGPRFHLSTYTTRSANLMLRQMGIVLYLACLGFSAGAGFFETVLSLRGLLWVGAALMIAVVPTIISGYIATRWFSLDYAQNAGMICAAMANPMALTYTATTSDEDKASEAYATVYPLSMFVRVISAQLLMLAVI